MSYIVYDLVILFILVLFALWGIRRGLILSFFSLLAVLVAFVGANLISNFWSPSVSGWIQPMISPSITAAIQSALPEGTAAVELPVEELLVLLDNAELPFGLGQLLPDFQADSVLMPTTGSLIESLSAALSEKAADAIAGIGLFLISFLLILIIWRLLGHTLDLVARLPGLHLLNKVGGLIFGLFRGALLLFVFAWIIRWLWGGLIPAEAVEQAKLLHFFMTVNPLDFLAKLKQ